MEVDIEGNPSQGEAPETKTKKNGKAKRVDAIVAPPNTLTRFLSLAGPPFSSAWEDVNRQCPVCQQNGFSSRGLALHVNSCLDTGAPKVNEQGEDQGTDTNDEGLQAEVARGRAGAAGGRARVAANGASAPSCHARYNCADATDRSGKHDQASPNASTSSAGGDGTREEAGKSGVRQGHTLKGMRPPTGEKKGSKVRHAFSRVGKPGSGGAKRVIKRPDAKPLQPRVPNSTHAPATNATHKAPQHVELGTQGRRRGLLARPRPHAVGDSSTPAPAVPSKSTRNKSTQELARDDIVRAQLLYVLEASDAATKAENGRGGWLGTTLFPKVDAEGEPVGIGSGAECGSVHSHGRSESDSENAADYIGCDSLRCSDKTRRVRPRPASWGTNQNARSRGDEGRGRFGMWPEVGDYDCWGEGDGYITLRPFPSRETITRWDSQDVDKCNYDKGSSKDCWIAHPIDARRGLSAGSSLADRFLEVFNQLQPTRAALKLEDCVFPAASVDMEKDTTTTPQQARADPETNASGKKKGARAGSAALGDWATMIGTTVVGAAMARPKKGGQCSAREGMSNAPADKRQYLEHNAPTARGTKYTRVVGDKTMPPNPKLGENVGKYDGVPFSSRRNALQPEFGHVNGRSEQHLHCSQSRSKPLQSHRSTSTTSTEFESRGGHGDSSRDATESAAINLTSDTIPPELCETSCANLAMDNVPATPATNDPEGVTSASHTAVKENPRPVRSIPRESKPAQIIARAIPFLRTQMPTPASHCSTPVASDTSKSVQASVQPPTSGGLADVAISPELGSGGSASTTPYVAPAAGAQKRTMSSANTLSYMATCEAAVVAPRQISNGDTPMKHKATSVSSSRSWDIARPRIPSAVATVRSPKRGGSSILSYAAVCEAAGVVPKQNVVRESSVGPEAATPAARQRGWNSGAGGLGQHRMVSSLSCGLVRRNTDVVDGARSNSQQEGNLVAGTSPSVRNNAPLVGSGGRKANVPQKGTLRVVHFGGATLRSSWDIDDSVELGKVVYGNTLQYDAVWYLPPPDAECVGVTRYRVVPHSLLAPTGGWMSERGRFASDPFVIVEASPATSPRIQGSTGIDNSAAMTPGTRHTSIAASARGGGNVSPPANVHRQPDSQPREHSGVDSSISTPVVSSRDHRASSCEASHGSRTGQRGIQKADTGAPNTGTRKYERDSHGGQSTRAMVNGDWNLARALSPLSDSAGPGRMTLPSAKNASARKLEINDSGVKVKCPVCKRGMDHWKPSQRQQHVHGCLLRQPPSASAKEQPSSAAAASSSTHPNAARTNGSNDNRSREVFSPTRGVLLSDRQRSARRGGRKQFVEPPPEGPRTARVSLQGVFSHPTATREPEKTLQGHRQSTMGHQDPPAPSRAHTASSTSHAPRNVNVPSNWAKGGPTAIGPLGRTNGSLFSKGGGTNASTTTVSTRQNGACRNIAGSDGSGRKGLKGPSECPFCKHSFAITLGQWEVQTHIQQCLESLEGVFDAEE